MPRNWIEPQEISIPQNIIESVSGHPLLAKTLYRRGLQDASTIKGFLDPDFYHPASPWDLPDMDVAVALLSQAINSGKHICVWGDFDVDGQTATTLLVTVLRTLGAKVIYHIPVRAKESHGIDPNVLTDFINQGIDLLLTCDTGIAAVPAIQLARQNHLDVIVTDHHDLPHILPPAQALVNPKRLNSIHPLSTLPGVGVAYKLAEALLDYYGKNELLPDLLDLVALGIISDLANLHGETRYLVQRGLPVLRRMNRIGLKFLADLAELNSQNISEDHISFVLAPRLNALGRLGDANSIVEFFTTTDNLRAQILAYELEGLNANRRLMSEQVYRAALSQLATDRTLEQFNVITLTHPSWPAGVIGIAAARLVEQFRKPVILFSSPAGQSARGSARSIEEINISSAIATQAHLLEGYGGHPMAAGLSIQPDKIPEFRRRISQSVEKEMQANPPENTLTVDNYLNLNELTLDLITDIERLAPFGMGNPPVLLACRNLSLTGYSAVGKHGEHLLMTLEDDLGYSQQAIWWQGADKSIPDSKFDLAFTARASTYRGQRGVQLEWIDYRPAVISSVQISSYSPPITVEDYRNEAEPLNILKRLRTNQDLCIYCEAEDRTSLKARDRLTIEPCNHLVIWSPPAGQSILQQILKNASPKFVYLFANPTSMDQPEAYLRSLAGLCKFAIRQNNGIIYLPRIASATNQRLETVRAGLQWLQTHGHIQIMDQEQDQVHIAKGIGTATNPDRAIAVELSALLDESKAFRNYYLRADKDRLIIADANPISKNRSSN